MEDAHKFMNEFLEFLQILSLSIIYFIQFPKTPSKLKSWSSSKMSSQNSNASLAPSRLSHHRDDAYSNWHDAVVYANSSACYDNDIVYENISTLPEPYKADNNENVNNLRNSSNQRHTIRQVMLRAKKNLPHVENPAPRKLSAPSIPKIIPNQILDDVQLFDAYYRSLDSVCTNSDSTEQIEPNNSSKRISIKNISKVFMPRHSHQKNSNVDATSNDIEKFM